MPRWEPTLPPSAHAALAALGRPRAATLLVVAVMSVATTWAVVDPDGSATGTSPAPASPYSAAAGPQDPADTAGDPGEASPADATDTLVGGGLPVAVGGLDDGRGRRIVGDLVSAGPPQRVRVPRLGVDASVLPISGQSGVLEPPADARELGWWQEGAVPGAADGSTVMTGHTVHTGGGALDRLAELVPGDRVQVVTGTGTVRYRVALTRVLSKQALAEQAADIFDLDKRGRLVLITCDDWDGTQYLSNAVVTAVPVAAKLVP